MKGWGSTTCSFTSTTSAVMHFFARSANDWIVSGQRRRCAKRPCWPTFWPGKPSSTPAIRAKATWMTCCSAATNSCRRRTRTHLRPHSHGRLFTWPRRIHRWMCARASRITTRVSPSFGRSAPIGGLPSCCSSWQSTTGRSTRPHRSARSGNVWRSQSDWATGAGWPTARWRWRGWRRFAMVISTAQLTCLPVPLPSTARSATTSA